MDGWEAQLGQLGRACCKCKAPRESRAVLPGPVLGRTRTLRYTQPTMAFLWSSLEPGLQR